MGFKLTDKLGYESPFQFTESQEIEFYEGGILFDELVNEIKSSNRFYFDYKNFISNTPETQVITPDGVSVETGRFLDEPLFIKDKDGTNRRIKIKGRLNTRGGQLDIRQNKVFFGFKLSVSKKEVEYKIKIKYRFNNNLAVELTTFSYSDFSLLTEYIVIEQSPKLKGLINKKFNEAFTKVNQDLSALKWLYENAPQFALKQRGDEKLLVDLQKLVTYDKDSWFKDASVALLNLIKGFNNLKVAYDFFHDNPQKTIAIYDVLDSASQEQFCVLLNVLCYVFTKPERRTTAKFTIGSDFTLNSNIFIKDNQKEILLEHSEIYRREIERPAPRDEFGISAGTIKTTVGTPIAVKQQTIFHPLDMVTMKDQSSGEERLVCALNVKLLSDQAEWEQVINTTVLVVSVIAILVSAGTLAAGATGLTAIIAITEIVVAAIDIAAILNNASLKETEEGRWFLKNWNALSAATGVASLVPGILKNGPKLLIGIRKLPNSVRVVQLRKFVNELITSITVELYFTYKQGIVFCSIIPFQSIAKVLGVNGTKVAQKMKKYGVLLTEPAEANSKVRALIYNGEKIAEGTVEELKTTLKSIFKYGADDADVLKSLDELSEISMLGKTGTGGGFKYIEEITSLRMLSQEQPMSCAATCILQLVTDSGIATYRGEKLTEEIVRAIAKTDGFGTGTNIDNIGPTLREISNGKKIDAGSLSIPNVNDMKDAAKILSEVTKKPWIATLKPPGKPRHTIIVDKIEGGKVFVRDPWGKIKGFEDVNGVEAVITLDDFEYFWKGSRYSYARIVK